MTRTRSSRPSACLLVSLLIIPFVSFAQQTNPVERLKALYETHRQKIDAEALAAYSNVLVAVGRQLQQKADVPGYLLLKSEQTFLAKKQALPEGEDRKNLVSKLPALDAPLSTIEANRNTKMANLLKQYIPALETQIRQLMTADKLDEAEAAGKAKGSAEFALADFQSKLPKTELPRGKPMASTEKKPETKLPPSSGKYTVDARNPRGTVIGEFKKGDKIRVEYESGKWAGVPGEEVNPDTHAVQYAAAQICLTTNSKTVAVATIPIGTSGDPFTYECVADGVYRMRISDNIVDDNSGAVRYRVTRVEGEPKP